MIPLLSRVTSRFVLWHLYLSPYFVLNLGCILVFFFPNSVYVLKWCNDRILLVMPPLFGCISFKVFIMVLFYQAFQPEDSQSNILDDADDLFFDESIDSIFSVLRKEMEGQVFISNDPVLFLMKARIPWGNPLWLQKKS